MCSVLQVISDSLPSLDHSHAKFFCLVFSGTNTWVGAISLLWGSSWPRGSVHIPCIEGQLLYHWAMGQAKFYLAAKCNCRWLSHHFVKLSLWFPMFVLAVVRFILKIRKLLSTSTCICFFFFFFSRKKKLIGCWWLDRCVWFSAVLGCVYVHVPFLVMSLSSTPAPALPSRSSQSIKLSSYHTASH